MNDCVWCFIGVCECDEYRCAKYLSIDSEEGRKIDEAYDRALKAEALARELVATLKKAYEYIGDINSFYGQGLQVHGWHLNGTPEPLDNFIDSNDGCEVEEFVGKVLTKAKEALGGE